MRTDIAESKNLTNIGSGHWENWPKSTSDILVWRNGCKPTEQNKICPLNLNNTIIVTMVSTAECGPVKLTV